MQYKMITKHLIGTLFYHLFPRLSSCNDLKIIMMYHRVLEQKPEVLYDSGMYVTTKTLKMQLETLSRHFMLENVGEIVGNINSEQRMCAITFDDGWRDNYLYAYPLLKEMRAKATIFLPVSFIGKNRKFWFEHIWDIVKLAIKNNKEKEFIKIINNILPEWKARKIFDEEIKKLNEMLKRQNAKVRERIISDLNKEFIGDEQNEKDVVNWDEVLEMSKNNIYFGSHGTNHEILTGLNSDEKKYQIEQSKKILEKYQVKFDRILSYPNGDYDNETMEITRQANYDAAVTTKMGVIKNINQQFCLPRIPMHEDIGSTIGMVWYRILQALTPKLH